MNTVNSNKIPQDFLTLWSQWPQGHSIKLKADAVLPGTLILLPFCDKLDPILAFYQADCKVVASNINPLILLALEAKLTSLEAHTVQTTFICLADSLKYKEPLHKRIKALYQSSCPTCQEQVSADYFIWDSDLADPQQKWLSCSHCGFAALTPTTEVDLATLDALEVQGLHYHFLLERTAKLGQAARPYMETLHDLYTPRALYAIAEILMKIEVVIPDMAVQRIFKTMLLDCLLAASSLFRKPDDVHLPKRLRPPQKFVEQNVWMLFEKRVATWQMLSISPRLLSNLDLLLEKHQNGIHLFPYNAVKLASHLTGESLAQVLSTLPPVNPITWSLATLWSGWLLGLSYAERLHPLLKQKGIDWAWYQNHLLMALKALRLNLKADATWIVTVTSSHPLQVPALILAALRAGFEIDDWDIGKNHHQLILIPTPAEIPPLIARKALQSAIQQEAIDTIQGYLSPDSPIQSKQQIVWAVWQSLLFSGLLAQAIAVLKEKEGLLFINKQIEATLKAMQREVQTNS